MQINDIEKNPKAALKYMERAVNDGSPTGLKFTNNVSLQTNPWINDEIELCVFDYPNDFLFVIGEESEHIQSIVGDNGIVIHPDFSFLFSNAGLSLIRRFKGCPTSSSRTVFVDSINCYIKLHYPGILGRVDKSLSKQDIINSIDVTNLLSCAVKRKKVSSLLAFFPEKSGRIGSWNGLDFSFTIRSAEPFGNNTKSLRYIIPAFSLYGQDYNAPFDESILSQLIKLNTGVGKGYIEKLLIPIVDCYLSLLFYEGLQHEMHSQNFLLGFDENWDLCSIILRDIESIQKDLTIRKNMGITDLVKSYPSRCLLRNQVNYAEKHSFMYDHKLFDFFIKPLVDKIETNSEKKEECYKRISSYVRKKYMDQINEYFPKNGKWYKFEDVIVSSSVKRRLFLECDFPRIR